VAESEMAGTLRPTLAEIDSEIEAESTTASSHSTLSISPKVN